MSKLCDHTPPEFITHANTWGNHDVKYDYTAELTGAGSRSEFYTK